MTLASARADKAVGWAWTKLNIVDDKNRDNWGKFQNSIVSAQGPTPPQPWCQAFVNYSLYVAKGRHSFPITNLSTHNVYDNYGGISIKRKHKPIKGDWVYMNMTGAGHVELAVKREKNGIWTLGGNTSNPGGNNIPLHYISGRRRGQKVEGVFFKFRTYDFLDGYLRPPYV
jgi:hypothetical protein